LGEPAAEMPAAAVALGATVTVQSVRGNRRIAADALYLGPYMTVLEPDEILTSIEYPQWPAGTITVFREVAQRPGDFALVGLVGAVVVDGGVVSRAGLAWFGMGPTPVKARQAEAALVGQSLSRIDPTAIAELALADTAPFGDVHVSAEYRRTVGRRIFARTLREALDLKVAA
jgi:carbon-monoxide dehydrogenase medium subunit